MQANPSHRHSNRHGQSTHENTKTEHTQRQRYTRCSRHGQSTHKKGFSMQCNAEYTKKTIPQRTRMPQRALEVAVPEGTRHGVQHHSLPRLLVVPVSHTAQQSGIQDAHSMRKQEDGASSQVSCVDNKSAQFDCLQLPPRWIVADRLLPHAMHGKH